MSKTKPEHMRYEVLTAGGVSAEAVRSGLLSPEAEAPPAPKERSAPPPFINLVAQSSWA